MLSHPNPTRRDRSAFPPSRPDQRDYRTLAAFRHLLRRFLGFSEAAARDAGLTPQQHQALLAIKGFPGGNDVTIHDLAEQLCVRHHSAVELVDRLVAADLVVRRQDPADRRRVLLDLTSGADRCLAELSTAHLEELRRLGPTLVAILNLLHEKPERSVGRHRGTNA